MSEPRHTPGPWEVGKNTSSKTPVLAKRKDIDPHFHFGSGEELDALAVCYGNSETRKANARLIAAAPELLEALKWAMRHVENVFALAAHHDPERAQLEAARAVIAKAEGKQKNGSKSRKENPPRPL